VTAPAAPLPSLEVGDGRTILVLHGFGMEPSTYQRTTDLLAARARVVIPDLFAVPGRWTFDHALDCLVATLDEVGAERVSLLGHSFGGALELGLAARLPDRVVECVFSDTLGVSKQLSLAIEAVHPIGIMRMATRVALHAFVHTSVEHPVQLARAALWAFASDRSAEIEAVAVAHTPCHVLWAESDTILSRADGREFSERLDATFTVAQRPPGYPPIDHDWMFDDPDLFVEHLTALDLEALRVSR
jgi:pimeloyl-ACP methyl ester carboxylesterase